MVEHNSGLEQTQPMIHCQVISTILIPGDWVGAGGWDWKIVLRPEGFLGQ
jgi:hypothetical protein